MDSQETRLPRHHQAVVDKFVAACLADERVVAAFVGGSYAKGTADAHSDLDLGLITTDEAYEAFWAGRDAFIRLLGEPAFLEDFDLPDIVFFIFPDGAECELAIGREGRFQHIHSGPYRVLLDKKRVLEGMVFPWIKNPETEQTETLRRLVSWFWHDLSHFATAMARGQLWWAYGQLEALRLQCVNLARLDQDFLAATDGYEKLEQAVRVERLSSLQATFCPMERGPMLDAALTIVRLYRELAPPLARTHGIAYPDGLERPILDRLKELRSQPP